MVPQWLTSTCRGEGRCFVDTSQDHDICLNLLRSTNKRDAGWPDWERGLHKSRPLKVEDTHD